MSNTESRECSKHGATEHTFSSEKRWRCKKCGVYAVTKRRRVLKIKAVWHKGGECIICGYKKCMDALVFHHRDKDQKEFGIGTSGCTRSWGKIKKELDKCDLLCVRCHTEKHSEEYKEDWDTVKEEDKVRLSVERNFFCSICNNKLKKNTKTGLCIVCYKPKRKVDNRPSQEQLLKDISDFGYTGTGRKYGVSDNSIRKWIIN
jgi:hypothetical protein